MSVLRPAVNSDAPGRFASPAKHFAKGKNDPGSRTKLAIRADVAVRARAARFTFREACADSAHGDHDGFRSELAEAALPFAMAL